MDKVPAVMTNEELENAQICLRKELIDIKTQIDNHNLTKKHLDENDLQDDKWIYKAKYALRLKGHQHNLVCKEIGVRNKAAKEGNKKFSDFFVDAAQSCLDGEMFQDIKLKANNMRIEYYEKNPTPGLIKVDY